MEELAGDLEVRQRMAKNALAKADTFCPDKVVEQWISLIKTIVGDR